MIISGIFKEITGSGTSRCRDTSLKTFIFLKIDERWDHILIFECPRNKHNSDLVMDVIKVVLIYFAPYPKINGNILDIKSVYVAFCSILTGT